MTATCGNIHPQHTDLCCENNVGNHKLCTGYHAAIDEFLDWENPAYEIPKTKSRRAAQEHLANIASHVAPDIRVASASASSSAEARVPSGISKGVAESKRSAQAWDDTQKKLVMSAILAVAKREDEFTTDAVWAELGGAVPVTKGMTSMLLLAVKRNIIGSTGKTMISSRGGEHDHGQRLTVWYSLIQEK